MLEKNIGLYANERSVWVALSSFVFKTGHVSTDNSICREVAFDIPLGTEGALLVFAKEDKKPSMYTFVILDFFILFVV